MTTENHTLFISDLHLDAKEPHITQAFFYFLEHIAPQADALYILGDFFESYVGDDDHSDFIDSIIHALSKFSDKHIPVYFMQGNRDFLIGQKFLDRAQMHFLSDPVVINLYNQKILLLHGDSLCTKDKSHQRFRKISRNKIIQKIFLSLPLSFRKNFAKKLRTESMQYNTTKSSEIMDVSENAVNAALKKYHVNKMIHGHTHKPMITEKRIVLGAWHNQGNYLRIDTNSSIELIHF